jgi:hypothetical protein
LLRFASSSRKISIQIVHQQVCSYSQCFVVVVPATAAGRAWAMLSCFACAETRRAVPSLPVLTPRPPLRHDQTRSSSAKPPGSHRRRQPDSQRSLPSQREMELDHGTDAAETDRRTIEVSMCTVVDHVAVAIILCSSRGVLLILQSVSRVLGLGVHPQVYGTSKSGLIDVRS